MRRTWQLKGPLTALTIVGRADARREDGAPVRTADLCAQLDAWLTAPASRELLFDLHTHLYGPSWNALTSAGPDFAQRHIRPRLEEAIKCGRIVAFAQPPTYSRQTRSAEDREESEASVAPEPRRSARPATVDLWIRLELDPAQASAHDDRFVLMSDDRSYRSEKRVKDDQVPGDAFVDLRYTGLDESLRYTLQVEESRGASPYTVFANVPYRDLIDLSAGAAAEEERPELHSPEEGSPYPAESDEE